MSILSEIYEYKKNFVENKKIKSDINKLKELSTNYTPKGFTAKIKDSISKKNISIIGELKKASPSAGIISRLPGHGLVSRGGVVTELLHIPKTLGVGAKGE